MPSAKENKHQVMDDEDDVDLGLLNQQFPKFNCICELCDCGCVQRKGGHSKNCKRQHHKKLEDDKDGSCMLTHYQQTFKRPDKSNKRRLPMIPPPTPRDHHRPPMDLTTTQRADFIQRGEGQRAELLKRPENYETSSAPVEGKTSYNQSFQGHSFPDIKLTRPGTSQKTLLVTAKFDSRTTNKEAFRDWVPEPSVCFKDLPSFAGSILYPGKSLEELHSTTQVDFPGSVAPRPQQIKMAPGNITIEGSHDLATTHKLAFVDKGTGHKATKVNRLPQMNTNRKAKLDGQTQTMRDFSMVAKSQPLPRKAAEPHPETIRLSFDSRLDFTTEQRDQFEGHDTSVHKRSNLIRKAADGSMDRPHTKFHTTTTNKETYRPIDVRGGLMPKSKAIERARRIPTSAKFDDQTMNKRYFKNWGAKPRVRYTNIREAVPYMPPRESMETETSTTSVYRRPIYMEQLGTFKPVENPMEHAGKHDFKTVHKETYQGLKPKPCKATLFLLQQEMKKRKASQGHHHPQALTVE